MNKRMPGKTGLLVSEIGFGVNGWNDIWKKSL